jgi:GTP-binding protein HflX
LFVSAKTKENIDGLKKTLYEEVKKIHITRFPYNDFLYDENWTVKIEQ